jgi:hypothetical protein
MGGACGTQGRRVHRGIWWENLNERDHPDDLRLREMIILNSVFKLQDSRPCIGFTGFRTGASGRLKYILYINPGFHNMRAVHWLSKHPFLKVSAPWSSLERNKRL